MPPMTSHDTSPLATASMSTPVGELHLFADDHSLVAVLWPDAEGDVPLDRPAAPVELERHAVLARTALQLREYFDGTRTTFDLPLAPRGTDFQLAAWRALQEIPYGETRSYAQQAESIGRPRAVRAVGAANGRNMIPIIVPCHRVIGANGSLTGFAGGLAAKRWLLAHEQRSEPNGRLFADEVDEVPRLTRPALASPR